MTKLRLSLALFGVLTLTACREGAQPYLLEQSPFDTVGGIRLTYSTGRDRAPVWSDNGDSIYYVAEGVYPPFPETPGLLLSVPANGGLASPIMRTRQVGNLYERYLTAAAVSPDGSNAAYVDLVHVEPGTACRFFCTVRRDTAFTQPRLVKGVVRISKLDPTTVTDIDTTIVSFIGRFFDTGHSHYGLEGTWILTAYPFQRRFAREGAHVFRPSWSPDGKQLVYSDGLKLIVHNIETRQSRILANTGDAVYPAWSPKGDWIAFSKLLRSDSTVTECLCFDARTGQVNEAQQRIIFNETPVGEAALVLVRPDGSAQRILGPGDMPAWMPDGERLVFRRGEHLWRAGIDGTQAQKLAGTLFAEEPAVSPNGRRIAFTRLNETNYDVWVIPLRIE